MQTNGVLKIGTLLMITVLCLHPLVADAAKEVDYQRRYAQDLQSIRIARSGMQSTLEFIDAHPEIFSSSIKSSKRLRFG